MSQENRVNLSPQRGENTAWFNKGKLPDQTSQRKQIQKFGCWNLVLLNWSNVIIKVSNNTERKLIDLPLFGFCKANFKKKNKSLGVSEKSKQYSDNVLTARPSFWSHPLPLSPHLAGSLLALLTLEEFFKIYQGRGFALRFKTRCQTHFHFRPH